MSAEVNVAPVPENRSFSSTVARLILQICNRELFRGNVAPLRIQTGVKSIIRTGYWCTIRELDLPELPADDHALLQSSMAYLPLVILLHQPWHLWRSVPVKQHPSLVEVYQYIPRKQSQDRCLRSRKPLSAAGIIVVCLSTQESSKSQCSSASCMLMICHLDNEVIAPGGSQM